jgi:hypothetical protein
MSTLKGMDPQELQVAPVPPSGVQAGATGASVAASGLPLVLPLVEPLVLPLVEPLTLPLVEPLVLPLVEPLAEPEPPSMFGLGLLLLSSLLQAPVAAEAATSARTTPASFKKRRFAFITQPRKSQNGT